MSFIELKHNMEVAHRLYNLPGKCQKIHGHSMVVTLRVHGEIKPGGILHGFLGQQFEFGAMKKSFRSYLDDHYDHQLLLNKVDPWAGPIFQLKSDYSQSVDGDPAAYLLDSTQKFLPGLVPCEEDPTTENIAKWIAEKMCEMFDAHVEVFVQETATNGVGVFASRLPLHEGVVVQ